jgi:hypothetical protein
VGRPVTLAAAVSVWFVGSASVAGAQPAPEQAGTVQPSGPLAVAFGADEVRFDEHARALDASGHVHVDATPFHLTSDELALKRVPIGVELTGKGELAFCPCLGTPLAVRFDGATVAPPHDVILHDATLLLFGLPLAWSPVVWLRSPARVGVLAPEVAWRGPDGLFLGEGVHVPWANGDAHRGLDVRAGAYLDGGAAVDGAIHTATTETRVRWDMLRGDNGVGIDARGATGIAASERIDSVAWDVDALRGARAVRATSDVDAAARPFDRGEGEMAWRAGGWTVASGVRTVALRGGDLADVGSGGPVVAARRADALAHAGAYDATIEAGSVAGAGYDAATFARAEGGALLAARLGPVGTTLALRGVGDVADDGTRGGADGAAQARASAALPAVRGFASDDAGDPWVHVTEPRLEVAGVASHTDGLLVVPPGRGMQLPSGETWIAGGAWRNAVGRWGSRGTGEVDVGGGAVGEGSRVFPVLRGRAAVDGYWAGLRADFARVLAPADARGGALVARARIGPERGLSVSAHVAQRDGVDPLLARALADAPLEPASGFLVSPGWTGGARASIPIGSRITARGGADADLDASQLVAAVASLELHDPCNCVVVRATVAHRIGRDGVDAWLAVDLPTNR